ncbi:CPBP family glutamic-type intramembrane protease [Hymenobacter volaticus]|uniref:CPBP family glutamic-type intramembrane protease n=1 Tax=Hymenobacter volaticus TaxID=2932254 RepID=A0ABY4GDW2_9BACT|nr:CPBP family glutamic-type intramembrane protease [Hymenobacter volaticus]UOQ69068.1 CPBP family glutamic-type intramembrane protease [Hymenobacter volaticus]
MSLTEGATIFFWGLLWAGFCIGLCLGPWRAAPRLLGWAAVACVVHLYTLWLVPPWTVWVYWLGLVPVTWLREMAWPVPLNGLGKGAGVLCSLGWVYLWRRITPAATGLVRPAPGSVRAIAPAVLVVAAGVLVEAYASRFAFLPLTAIQHLYYLTLPGLDEELFYRGALLGLLAPACPAHCLYSARARVGAGWWGAALHSRPRSRLPERLFELGCGADFWRYVRAWWSPTHFPLPTVLFQLGMGTFFLWVRERTGSAWVAAFVHCLVNGCLSLGHAAG